MSNACYPGEVAAVILLNDLRREKIPEKLLKNT